MIENKTSYSEEQLLGIAARNGNSKRPFVIVNKLQAKHIPAVPSETLAYFRQLGSLCAETCGKGEKVLVSGFAETATALGAIVAEQIPNAVYIHTTRETVSGKVPLVEFQEEHSHAVEQWLYCDLTIDRFDRIILVDDEITTGKTCANLICALSGKVKSNVRYTIAALTFSGQLAFDFPCDTAYLHRIYSNEIIIPNINTCEPIIPSMSVQSLERYSPEYLFGCHDILVLGTEECMLPALKFGEQLEQQGFAVCCHSTTRSPILPSEVFGYPLVSRGDIPSLYDVSRRTYVYNLRRYDAVVIVTDASPNQQSEGYLCGALAEFGNDNISISRCRCE
ncbi:MAG: phosphoribosyltransferase family protein [Clostridiales Family XIII bacterium]|nr:phosphoribosyltransferase family protein [Clostridiales Family XIII bacterium]